MDSLETEGYRYHHVPIWQSEILWVKKKVLFYMLMTLINKNFSVNFDHS